MFRNVFAYTADGADSPEFLSVNRHDDGRLVFTVRSPGEGGATAEMTLPEGEIAGLANALHLDRLDVKRTDQQRAALERCATSATQA